MQTTYEKMHFLGWNRTLFFCVNFMFFEFFWNSFSHRFLDAFLTKKRSKMTPKLSAWDPPCSTFFEVAIFCGISVDFGLTFGAPLAPFGLILVAFWLNLGSFWCHVGSDFGYFAPSGFRFCSFWAIFIFEGSILQKLHLASNFLQIFACKLSSLGLGVELLPHATEIDIRKGSLK